MVTRIALTILLVCLPLATHAQLYKCKRADGSSTFQDAACPDGASSTKIAKPASSGSAPSITLTADAHGHFHAPMSINNVAVDGIVDTGATMTAISLTTAHEMGISVTGSKVGIIQTANGAIYSYFKMVPKVKIGEIDVYDVEVTISEGVPTLIGMNVLKRFKINQENGQLILLKQW